MIRDLPGTIARIAGGMHGLPELAGPRPDDRPGWRLPADAVGFFNGRCALHTLVRRLRPGRVWLPSFLCHTMVKAVATAGVETDFYSVDERLQCTALNWPGKVARGDLVLVVDYFGFPADREIIRRAQAQGAAVIEDAAHSFLSAPEGSGADFVIFSFRKTVGVPAGAAVVARDPAAIRGVDLRRVDASTLAAVYRAFLERTEFDRTGVDPGWFASYQAAERAHPIGEFALDDFSRGLLESVVDFAAIAASRRSNYSFLAGHLGRHALFPQLPEGVVPLGFPIAVQERDVIQRRLFAASIFCPIHWAIADVVPESFSASHELSRRILTLLCDQRCTAEQLETMVRVVTEVAG
jgi:dTDP-4-amino-4,6-dideoxygalactose transaminase